MPDAVIRIEGMGKCYRLGETHAHTLAERLSRAFGGAAGKREQGRKVEDFWALRDIDLEVMEGEALGIVGGNGAGKSTLLKILSRITQPTTGRALVRGRLASLLEVGTGFHPELTGRENVYLNGTILGMRRNEVARKFDEIVAFAGVEKFIDTPVKRYSSGMYVRLAFAVAAHLEPDVLIVDEVLAVGDAGFQKRCLGKMSEVAQQGRTILFVSHNMAAIQKLCARAVWLKAGRVVEVGDSSQVVNSYLEASAEDIAGEEPTVPGYAYHRMGSAEPPSGAVLKSVQLLDREGIPRPAAATWEPAVFRIEFQSSQHYRSFSVVLQVSTLDGVSLLLSSTTPDHAVPFEVAPGRYRIDCSIGQFPLAAGEYVVGLGLAIPGVEYVWRNDALFRLHVQPRDVYRSGLPPGSNRYLVACAHEWSRPSLLEVATESGAEVG